MHTQQYKVRLGLFIMGGLTLFVLAIFIIGKQKNLFNPVFKLTTTFYNVSGLQVGNNIRFSGINVGTVDNIVIINDSMVRVDMLIRKEVQQFIKSDCEVGIGSSGIIGDKLLIITQGSSDAALAKDGQVVASIEPVETDAIIASLQVTAVNVEKITKQLVAFTSDEMINALRENNVNLLAITADFKKISKKLANGEGTIGKLLNDNSVYENINAAAASLQSASAKSEKLISALADFSSGLNKKGTLINELTTDTLIFNSMKASVTNLHQITKTADLLMTNLNQTVNNPTTTLGVMLHDEASGTKIKETIKNLESSSKKLDEALEAAQHNFLLRGYFRKKGKANIIESQ